MTVPSENSYAEMAWTGVETSFAPGFRALALGYLEVYSRSADGNVTLLTKDVHYSVALDSAGAVTVTPIALPPAPRTILIARRTPATQALDFTNLGKFTADTHTHLHDASAMRDGELLREVGRSVRLPLGENAELLPPASVRRGINDSGTVLAFDGATGAPVVSLLIDLPTVAVGSPGPAGFTLTSTGAGSIPQFLQPAGVPHFDSRAAAAAATIPTFVSSIVLDGYYSFMDGGQNAIYREVANTGPLAAWHFLSNAGTRRWSLTGRTVTSAQFGCKSDCVLDGGNHFVSGTNNTDDLNSITNGDGYLSVIGGGTLIISPGRHYVGAPGWISYTQPNITIVGADTTSEIYFKDFGVNGLLTVGKNFTVRNLGFRSDPAIIRSWQLTGIFAPDFGSQVDDLTIENCRFDDLSGNAVFVNNGKRPRFINNVIRNMKAGGIQINSNNDGWLFMGNVAENCGDDTFAVLWTPGQGATRGGMFIGNTVSGGTWGMGLALAGVTGFYVGGNNFYHTVGPAIGFYDQGVASGTIGPNRIEGCGQIAGAATPLFDQGRWYGSGVAIDYCTDLLVEGQYIKDHNLAVYGATLHCAYYVGNAAANVTIKGGRVENCRYGIVGKEDNTISTGMAGLVVDNVHFSHVEKEVLLVDNAAVAKSNWQLLRNVLDTCSLARPSSMVASNLTTVYAYGNRRVGGTPAFAFTMATGSVQSDEFGASELWGNPNGSAAEGSRVTIGATLGFSGASLQTQAGSGDVSWSANSFVTAIGANKVLDTMLRAGAARSLIGRSASTGGNVADITASSGSDAVLRESGGVIGFGTLATNAFGANVVTYAKWQQVGAFSIVGNVTGSAATATDITLGATFSFSGTQIQSTSHTGDVTSPGNSHVMTISANAVSYAKWQQVGAFSIVGNVTGSLANATDITLGATFSFSGTQIQSTAHTGDVTSPVNSHVMTIPANQISNAMLRQSAGLSLVGRSASGTGNVADIVGTASQFLGINAGGTAVAFQTMSGDATMSGPALTLAANVVTYGKFQQVAASSLVGNPTGSLANAQGLTLGATLAFSGTALQTVAFTGDVTTSANSFATTIANDAVSNAKAANMATKTYKGRTSAGTGDPEDVAAATVLSDIGALPLAGGTMTGPIDRVSGSTTGRWVAQVIDALANNATAVLNAPATQPVCFAEVINKTGVFGAIFFLRGTAADANEFLDTANQFSAVSGTAGTNIFASGGTYLIENKTGGTASYVVFYRAAL